MHIAKERCTGKDKRHDQLPPLRGLCHASQLTETKRENKSSEYGQNAQWWKAVAFDSIGAGAEP
jgi:hypothetical protein